ncbi:MAG: hypothetical protein PHS64_02375, partial [Candidatus Omnitrophica bacterium]|nr:hypothetical protein [Candidatus Omnitrophota bacterium]
MSDSWVAADLQKAGFDVTVDWLIKQGGIHKILRDRWDLWTRPGSEEWNRRQVKEFLKRFRFDLRGVDSVQARGRARYEQLLGALVQEGLHVDYVILEEILNGNDISKKEYNIRKDPDLTAVLKNDPGLADAIENPRIHKGLGSAAIKKAIRENPTRQDAIRTLNAKTPDLDMKKMSVLAEQYPDIGVLWDQKPELDLAHARSRGYMELELRAVMEPEPVGQEAARQPEKDSRLKAGRQDYLDAAVDAFIKHRIWKPMFIIAALERKGIRGHISEIRRYSEKIDFMRDYRKSIEERLKNASQAKDGGEGDDVRALLRQKLTLLVDTGDRMPAGELRAWLAQEHGVVRERWAIRRSLNALFNENAAFRNAVDEEKRGTAEGSRRIRKLLEGRLAAIVLDHEKEQDIRQLIRWLKTQGIARKHDAIREHLERIFENKPELRIAVDLKGVINEWQRARAHLRMTKSVARTLEKIRHDLPRLSPLGFLLMAAVDPELDPNIIAMVKAYRGELKSVIALRRLLQDRGFLRDFGKINNRKSAQNAIGWLLETGSYEESSGRIGQKTGTLRVFIEQFAYDKTERIKPYIEAAAMGLADPDNIPSDLTRSQKGRMRLSFRVQREELRKEEEYAALYIRESIDATVKPIARREQQLLELIKIKHRQPVKRRYGGSLKSVFARRSSNFLMELIRAAEGNVDMLWEKTVRPLNIIDEAGYRLFMEQTLMKHPRYREEIKWRMSWNQLSDDQIADVWLQAGFSSREERFFEIMAAWTLATNKPFMPGQLGSEAMLIMKEEGRGLVSFLAENFECENIPLLVRFYPSSNYLMSPALARIVLGSDENMQNAADEHAGVAAARANAINERKPWEDVLPWEMSNVVSGEAAAECGPYSQADGGTKTKQVVLVVLDGFGYRTEKEHNAIALAHKPNWDALISRFGFTLLETSGEAVGLPEGEMGSSEVGHQNMGGGRKVKQEVIRIKESIADRSFFNNQVLLEGSRHVQTHPGASLHLMGLLSNAVVHSDLKHLCALLEFAGQEGLQDVYIHPLMDGRDSPPTSGAQWMADLAQESERIRVGSVASVIGRYFAMDRDNNWELIKTAYDLFTQGMGTKAVDPVQAVKNAYERQEKAGTKVSDEHIRPIVMVGKDQQPLAVIKDNDAVIFFNFRADRARQITRAFMDDRFVNDKAFSIRAVDLLGKRAPESLRAWAEKRSRNFERAVRPDIKWLCMTEYDRAFYAFKNLSVIFPPRYVENNLAEYLASLGKKQLHIAETQKFAHSTFFFNGGREEPFAGEDRILIPSPKVDTFDLKPEMSAFKIARKLVKQIKRGVYDFTLVNFANADMVGHEGKLDAAIKAIEVVDQCLGKVLPAVAKQDGIAIVTADHGNAEDMAGKYQTSHTLNPVPFTIFDPAGNLGRVSLRGSGALCDVAPTVLEAMGLPQPPEMTGLSLIKRDGGYDRADGNKKEEGLKQLRAYLREFSAHAYGFTGPTRLLWITQMVRVLLPRKARDALDIRKTIEKQRNDLVRMVRELHETYGFNEQDFRVEAGTLERRARRAQAISFICTAFFVSLFFVNIGSPALFYTGLIASVWAGGWAFSFALNEGHRRKLLIWAVRQEFAAAAPLARHKEQSLSEGIRIETTDGAHLSLTEAEYGGHIKGQLKIVRNASQNHKVWIGDVLVADQTTPDMLPAMKRAGAIIVRTRDYLARNFAKTNRIPFTDGPMFSPDMPGDNAWVDINTLKIIVGPDETLGMTADVSAADIMEYLKKHALEQLQEMQEGRMVEASHIDIKEVFRTYGIDVDALGRMNGEQAQALLNALKLLPEEHLHYLEEIKEVPGRMRGRVGGYIYNVPYVRKMRLNTFQGGDGLEHSFMHETGHIISEQYGLGADFAQLAGWKSYPVPLFLVLVVVLGPVRELLGRVLETIIPLEASILWTSNRLISLMLYTAAFMAIYYLCNKYVQKIFIEVFSISIRTKDISPEHFVSEYAAHSPYESFAEAYYTYISWPENFRRAAEDSEDLKKQYDFLKDYCFAGVEYTRALDGSIRRMEYQDGASADGGQARMFSGDFSALSQFKFSGLRAVIFDIAGVLHDGTPERTVERLCAFINERCPGKVASPAVVKALFYDCAEAKKLRVDLLIETFLRETANPVLEREYGARARLTVMDFMHIFFLDWEISKEMAELVQYLKHSAGLELYMLSNFFKSEEVDIRAMLIEKFEAACPGCFPIENVVLSNVIGVSKPDLRAFAITIDIIEKKVPAILPSDALFIDDLEGNTAAAVAYGINGWTFGHDGGFGDDRTDLAVLRKIYQPYRVWMDRGRVRKQVLSNASWIKVYCAHEKLVGHYKENVQSGRTYQGYLAPDPSQRPR